MSTLIRVPTTVQFTGGVREFERFLRQIVVPETSLKRRFFVPINHEKIDIFISALEYFCQKAYENKEAISLDNNRIVLWRLYSAFENIDHSPFVRGRNLRAGMHEFLWFVKFVYSLRGKRVEVSGTFMRKTEILFLFVLLLLREEKI